MASYYLNEAVFDLGGRSFVDRTIHGLEARLPGDGTLGVLVHRRVNEGDRPLAVLVAESIAVNHKRLGAFAVLDESPVVVGGLAGRVLRAQWRSGGTTFFQAQAHVVFEGKWIIFAVSAPLDERALCEETLEGIVSTVTWRSE